MWREFSQNVVLVGDLLQLGSMIELGRMNNPMGLISAKSLLTASWGTELGWGVRHIFLGEIASIRLKAAVSHWQITLKHTYSS